MRFRPPAPIAVIAVLAFTPSIGVAHAGGLRSAHAHEKALRRLNATRGHAALSMDELLSVKEAMGKTVDRSMHQADRNAMVDGIVRTV